MSRQDRAFLNSYSGLRHANYLSADLTDSLFEVLCNGGRHERAAVLKAIRDQASLNDPTAIVVDLARLQLHLIRALVRPIGSSGNLCPRAGDPLSSDEYAVYGYDVDFSPASGSGAGSPGSLEAFVADIEGDTLPPLLAGPRAASLPGSAGG